MIYVDKKIAEAAILGGAVLGGGGGGWIEEGRKLAALALDRGFSQILPLDSLRPEDLLLTVSAVGAPSAGKNLLQPEDYIRAVDFFLQKTGLRIAGLISSEVGALGVVNGWLQSAYLQIPVIDSPANGRAHPTGLMGAMGLTRYKDYLSLQAAVGRDLTTGESHDEFFSGPLEETTKAVREMARRCGGMVAVARNPVPAAYGKENGAPGAIRRTIELGLIYVYKKYLSPAELIREICRMLRANFLGQGQVEKFRLEQRDSFDLGWAKIKTPDGCYELTFWNEYMTLEGEGERLATFPDLIMTFEAATGQPLVSAGLEEGQEIFLLTVPANELLLGAGVKEKAWLRQVEVATGKEILKYCPFF